MMEKRFFIEGMPFEIQFFYTDDEKIRFEIKDVIKMKTYVTGDIPCKT